MALDKFGPNAFATGSVTSDALATGTIATEDIADGAVTGAKAVNLGRRNLIINGAMQVAQRGTSATGITGSGFHAVDRFATNGNNGTWTVSHDTDAPDGFSNSFKMLLTATEAVGNSSYMAIQQKIEGQNLQGLAYGTSSAKTVTVSFYVKSNVTGTYCFNLYQDDGTKNYPQNYTIDSADTWEYKTISFVGDTATSLDNDNASSLRAMFFLVAGTDFNSGSAGSRVAYTNATFAAGQTAVVGGAVNDYFQITGVQLEVGDTATPFEHLSYGEELALCQRYFYRMTFGTNNFFLIDTYADSGDSFNSMFVSFPVTMRTQPSSSVGAASLIKSNCEAGFNDYASPFSTTGAGWQARPASSGARQYAYTATGFANDFDAEL